jgi:hypothetical protein
MKPLGLLYVLTLLNSGFSPCCFRNNCGPRSLPASFRCYAAVGSRS